MPRIGCSAAPLRSSDKPVDCTKKAVHASCKIIPVTSSSSHFVADCEEESRLVPWRHVMNRYNLGKKYEAGADGSVSAVYKGFRAVAEISDKYRKASSLRIIPVVAMTENSTSPTSAHRHVGNYSEAPRDLRFVYSQAANAALASISASTSDVARINESRLLGHSGKNGPCTVSRHASFKADPVEAAAAEAVLGVPTVVSKKSAITSLLTDKQPSFLHDNLLSTKAIKQNSRAGSSSSLCSQVRAPTGSVSGKGDWNSFVDWKMMEYQDYQTIPDDQFHKLSEKLHIEDSWRPMVSYLVGLGMSTKDLERVLVNCEELFSRPVSKVVTRVDYLQNELGFQGRELCKLIVKEPKILLQRNRHTIPRCRFLADVGVSVQKLPTILRKQPQILHLSVQNGLVPRVSYFKDELLIPEAEIPKIIERNPAVLTFSVDNQIKPRVQFLRDLGISQEGIVKMIVRHPHLLHYSFEGLEEHISFLYSIGMDEKDVVHTVTRLSQLFSLSVENSLRPKFAYLTEELGGDVKTCVRFPAYFSLSLDQRIRPRHTYLQRYNYAPDPFPMKYLSECDAAFAARAKRSLEQFKEYKDKVVPIFKEETQKRKVLASTSLRAELYQQRMLQARIGQQSRLLVKNQGYTQRIVEARSSMNRVKLLGVSRPAN